MRALGRPGLILPAFPFCGGAVLGYRLRRDAIKFSAALRPGYPRGTHAEIPLARKFPRFPAGIDSLLLAKSNAWTCVSNDKRLRSACADEGVSVLWSLELLVRLVEGEAIPSDEAVDLARRMADGNPYLTAAVIERFVARVTSFGRR